MLGDVDVMIKNVGQPEDGSGLVAARGARTLDRSASALILLGRSGLGTAPRRQLQLLQEQLSGRLGDFYITTAYADYAGPSLPLALESCVRARPDLRQVVIQPFFVPLQKDAAMLRWLAAVAQRWRRDRAAAAHLDLVFAPPLDELPRLADAILEVIIQPSKCSDASVVSSGQYDHDPAGWSLIPNHGRHILYCMGPRCTAKGTEEIWTHLRERLRSKSALRRSLMLLHTSCQYPCNLGPMMIVYPDGTWLGHLSVDAIDEIIDAEFMVREINSYYVVHERSGGCGQCIV